MKPFFALGALKLAICTAGLAMGLVGTAFAVPLVQAKRTGTAPSGPQSYDWPSPATGIINGYSGATYATGGGTFSNGGNNYYNGWVTTHADSNFQGTISQVETCEWVLSVNYPAYIEAKTHYVPTGVPSMEDFRAEATFTAEMRGDFGPACVERQVAVDSYTTPGTTTYDAVGGGSTPMTYAGQGESVVVRAQSGVTLKGHGGNCTFTDNCFKRDIDFQLFARGKQYMKSDDEEDVSLYTIVTVTNASGVDGFTGTLTCIYEWQGVTYTEVFPVEGL